LAGINFSGGGKRIKTNVRRDSTESPRSAEDVVREIKKGMEKLPGEDYREKSLAIHGLICAYCGREFDHSNRHLLTIHHKDGNHHNNPPDGSNWENLCIYCHDNIHSRELLGDYFNGSNDKKEERVVYDSGGNTGKTDSGLGILGEKLQKAMKEKKERG